MQDMSASGDPARGVRTGVGAARNDTYVLVALARLERDHVALLAALCDLERTSKRRGTAKVPAQLSAPMRQALAILLRADLRQTQRALVLAADGRYGRCEECHASLSSVTLLTTPATTHCRACLERADRARQVH